VNGIPFDLAHGAVALRCFGCLVSLPLGEALTSFPRFLLAVGLSLLIFPMDGVREGLPLWSPLTEFVIGFALGAPLRCVADVSEMVGELIDTARGQTISAVLDPLHGHGSSDMAVLAKNASVVVALTCGAFEMVVGSLARSIEEIPLGSPAHDPSLMRGLARSGAFLLTEGMRLCAVWLGAFLLIDIACAFLSRVVSGLAFTQTAALLKMLVLFLLLIALLTEGVARPTEDISRVVAPWEWGSERRNGPGPWGASRGPAAEREGGR
jgi:type III secretory pathway component EscT